MFSLADPTKTPEQPPSLGRADPFSSDETLLWLPNDSEVPRVRVVSKGLFVAYLVLLVWLVLFKFSFDIPSAFEHRTRTLNLLPFTDLSRSTLREMFYNVVVFIPLGVLLSVNLKRANVGRKLAYVCCCSLAAELIQFVFAIGVTDTTDVITNTAGGFLGLLLYALGKKYVADERLDRFIVVAGTILLMVCIVLLGLLFSNGIRFRSAN